MYHRFHFNDAMYDIPMMEQARGEKGSDERNAAAKKITELRKLERDTETPLYTNTRGGAWYIEDFKGVQHLFDYVRTLPSRIVVDVGAGVLNGVSDLANSRFGKSLTFEATILARPKNMKNPPDKVRIHRTSVETLRGIKDASVGCIIGDSSIAYSEPSLAVQSIDRVLVPGGVLKATFAKKGSKSKAVEMGMKESGVFAEKLRALHYVVKEEPELYGRSIILAIKPGGDGAITAEELFRKDASSELTQIDMMKEDVPPHRP